MTVTDWIVAIVAVGALALSIYISSDVIPAEEQGVPPDPSVPVYVIAVDTAGNSYKAKDPAPYREHQKVGAR